MRVFRLRPNADQFRNLVVADAKDLDAFSSVNKGKSVALSWNPIEVKIDRETGHDKRPDASDFPGFSAAVPVFSSRAVSVLREVLEAHGEILPLTCREGTYAAYNLLTTIDALDCERSVVTRLPTGKIVDLNNVYVFKHELLAGVPIFRIPGLNVTFVTEMFTQAVIDNHLNGFLFPPV